MITQNLTQIVHLMARLHGLKRVFFTGNFLRHNDIALRTITYNMARWSDLDGEKTDVYFFKHEGYFGALGAFIENACECEASGLAASQWAAGGANPADQARQRQ